MVFTKKTFISTAITKYRPLQDQIWFSFSTLYFKPLYDLYPLCRWYTASCSLHLMTKLPHWSTFWLVSINFSPECAILVMSMPLIHHKLNFLSLPYYLNKLYNIKFDDTLIIQNPFFTAWCNFRWNVSFVDHINQGYKIALLPFKMIEEFKFLVLYINQPVYFLLPIDWTVLQFFT